MKRLGRKRLPIITRRNQQGTCPLRPAYIHFCTDCINQGCRAHRLYDASCSKNRYSSHNTKPWIEGSLRDCFSIRNCDLNIRTGAAAAPAVGERLAHTARDHQPRNAVDGGRAHRLVKPRTCHPANPHAAFNYNLRLVSQPHTCIDQCAVRHIGIVARVLAHRTACKTIATGRILNLQHQADIVWRRDRHLFNRFARNQHNCCGLSGGGGTDACCKSAAQFLRAADYIAFQRHISTSAAV